MTNYVVSIDTGDTTGIALWKEDGTFLEKMKMTHEEFIEWADAIDIGVSAVVCENYIHRLNQQYNKKGSKLVASEGKGIARAMAKRLKAKFVLQEPRVLRITALHAGVKLGRGHIPDDVSAYLHGFRYFLDAGKIEAVRPSNS